MDTEKLSQDLRERFAAPLPDYYKRRIIFWHDEEREFEDKLDELSLPGVRLARVTGSNHFAIKKLLCHDDLHSSFLVYCPVRYAEPDDEWLLDVRLYSEEFHSDLASLWMNEMRLPNAVRSTVKAYRAFFKAKERRGRVAAFAPQTSPQLHLAVMAAICGAKAATPSAVLRAVLRGGVDEQENEAYAGLEAYGAREAFWRMAAQATGYDDADASLSGLACHVLLTACTRTLRADALMGLERYLSGAHQAWCYDFVAEWMHSDEKPALYELARYVEELLHLPERFKPLAVAELLDTECFPCVHECILQRMMQDVAQQIIDVQGITSAVEKRRTCAWYDEAAVYYDGLMQVANMQRFFLEHATGFHTVEAQKIWQEYTADYYRMDGYYRQFHLCYSESLKMYSETLSDLFARVAQQAEGLYVHWFLDKLGENWTTAVEEQLRQYGRILEVPNQTDFYINHVKNSDKVVVVVSDALRYEVAASLLEQLRRETQGKVELTAAQGLFPTITKFGMAALLPHNRLTLEERANGSLAILADGVPTDSNYREKVLKAANPRSVALQYKEIAGMSTEKVRALTSGMDVVYIYHDTIDAASHAADNLVFSACDTAVAELQNLIRIATNKMNRTHVIITADHGFLYTYNPLQENSKVEKTSFQQRQVEYGRRYAIMRKGAAPDFLMSVRLMDRGAELEGFAPRESMRIKVQGGGMNFVHGGVSLQEICVPVLTYHHLRKSSKEYQKNKSKYDTKPVSISLLSANRKICNMIFALNFYQKEAVGENLVAQTYQLFFADEEGKHISDTQTIIADKTGASNQDRTFRCTFNLKPLKYENTATYYLIIMDAEGLTPPQREAFQIDIAFAVDEFDFFS